MLKKHGWIAALFVAVAMVFMACPPEPTNPPGGELVEVFNLADILADLDTQVIDTEAKFDAAFAGTPLGSVGSLPNDTVYEIIEEGGVKMLQITSKPTGWGAGIDINDIGNDPDYGINFKVGDRIALKLKATAAGNGNYFLLNANQENESAPIGAQISYAGKMDEWIEVERSLTAANVSAIKASAGQYDARALRIKIGAAPNATTPAVFVIEQFTIEQYSDAEEVELCPCCSNGCQGCVAPCDCGCPECTPLVIGDAEFSFDLDLTSYTTTSSTAGGMSGGVTVTSATATEIVLEYSGAADQRFSFNLTEEQSAMILGATNASIVIEGTANPAGTTFRYHIGNPQSGSSWNATNSFTDAPLADILEMDFGFSGNRSTSTVSHFILQKRAIAATTVTITKITISGNGFSCEVCGEYPCECVFNVNVAGTNVPAHVYANGGNVGYFDAGSGKIGYHFTSTNGYSNSYAKFAVDFGATDRLADFKEVKFNYEGVANATDKKFLLLAWAAEPTGWQGADSTVNGMAYSIGTVNAANGTITLNVNYTKAAASMTGQIVWFSLYIHSSSGLEFKISNIEFLKTGGATLPAAQNFVKADFAIGTNLDQIAGIVEPVVVSRGADAAFANWWGASTGNIVVTYKSSSPAYDSTTVPQEAGTYNLFATVAASPGFAASAEVNLDTTLVIEEYTTPCSCSGCALNGKTIAAAKDEGLFCSCDNCDDCFVCEIIGDGVVFSLTEWLKTNTTVGWNSRPLQGNSGSTTYVAASDGVTVSGRANSWDGLDLWIDAANLNLDLTAYTYTVYVEGNVVGTPVEANSQMTLGGSGTGSPGTQYGSYLTGENAPFSFTWDINPGILGNIRIVTNNDTTKLSFKITKLDIVITAKL